jgi:hypothetical protein
MPLGGLVPKMPSKQGPMKLPSVPSPVKKQGKKTLFDEEEEEAGLKPQKKATKKTSNKPNLFDDDGDE